MSECYIQNGLKMSGGDFPSTSLYLILRISFVLHIFSLKTWFDNRAKNEALLEMIQSSQTDNGQLEKDTINLTNKTQSMTEGAEILS